MDFKASDKEQIVPLDRITVDPRLQMRMFLSKATIDKYADDMRERGAKFPPMRACIDPAGKMWLWDGHHTYEAKKALKHPGGAVILEAGTFDDAFLKAAGANAENARERTSEDMDKAVTAVLEHPQYGKKSTPQIADICRVSEAFARRVRERFDALAAAQRVKEQAAEAAGKPKPKQRKKGMAPAMKDPATRTDRNGVVYPAKRKPRSGTVKVNWKEFHRCVGVLARFMDDMYRTYGKVDETAGTVTRDAAYNGVNASLEQFKKGAMKRFKDLAKEPAPEAS